MWTARATALLLLVAVVACSGATRERDAVVEIRDGHGFPRAIASAWIADAGTDAEPTASPALRVFPRLGSPDDDEAPPAGPGIVLDGGFDGPVVRKWIHETCARGSAGRGDVVVLTAYASDASSGWLAAAPFASVQTVAIADGATPDDLLLASRILRRAEIVWFTGGDQAKYVRWKGTPLMAAVQGVHDRGGVVGGVSAGMIILGSSVNDARLTLSENITTPLALSDPYDPRIHFTQRVLDLPLLGRTITDPHFSSKDRMGRLAAFMARQIADGFAAPDVLGIGVDDGAALVVNAAGEGRRLASGAGPGVFVVKGGAPERVTAGAPLVYAGLEIVKLADDTHFWDLGRRCGRGLARTIAIDGSRTPPYPADVYAGGEAGSNCR